jgi:predicted transcriptional regulator
MAKFQFRVSDQDLKRLQAIADQRGVSMSDLGRLALESYIDEALTQSNKNGPRAKPDAPHSRHKGKSEVEANITGPRLSVVERILAKGRAKPLVPFK